MDILCVQGIGFADLQRQIYQGLRQTYPYIYSILDFAAEFNAQRPACTNDEVRQFGTCVQQNGCTDLECLVSRYSYRPNAGGM